MHSYQIFSGWDSRKYNHGCYRSSFIIFYLLVSNKKYLTIFSFEMIISHLNESKVKKLPHFRWKSTVISPLFHLWRFSPLNCQSVFFNSFFFKSLGRSHWEQWREKKRQTLQKDSFILFGFACMRFSLSVCSIYRFKEWNEFGIDNGWAVLELHCSILELYANWFTLFAIQYVAIITNGHWTDCF